MRDERPHVNVTVDLDGLVGNGNGLVGNGRGSARFDDTRPVPADVMSEFLCDCVLTRILSRGSLVLDVGRSERLVTAAQRKAVIQRDRCCRFPGCDRPPTQCDVHHVVEWVKGGPTDLSNLVLPKDTMSDSDKRERIRAAIRRFQATTGPPGRDELLARSLARQRLHALGGRLTFPVPTGCGGNAVTGTGARSDEP